MELERSAASLKPSPEIAIPDRLLDNAKAENTVINATGHTVLAALGLYAATVAFESGMGLRSRCLLWPEEPMCWEILAKPGEPPKLFAIDSVAAKKLLADAISAAEQAGLMWQKQPLTLTPSTELLRLVRLSQQQFVKEGTAEES
jgi:CRISPR-associated protein Csb1